jgi:hypothetical protein
MTATLALADFRRVPPQRFAFDREGTAGSQIVAGERSM